MNLNSSSIESQRRRYRRLRLALISAASITLAIGLWPTSASATTYYWDTNGAAGFGGVTGAWDGTNAFWNTDNTGATTGTFVPSPTVADDLNISGGTTGTVTISGTGVGSSLTLSDNVPNTITGGTLQLGGTGASSGLFLTSAITAAQTVNSAISLNAAATIQDAGTGVLTIGGGITGTGNLTLNNNGATAGGITISTTSLNSKGTITNSGLGSGSVTISSGIGANVTGVNQNSSTSTLSLSGANSYTGPTTINAGTLQLINQTALASAITVNPGGTLELNSTNGTVDNWYNVAQPISGTGTVNKTGTGWIDVTSTTWMTGFNGTLNIQAGTFGPGGGTGKIGGSTSTMLVNVSTGALFDIRATNLGAVVSIDRLTGTGTVGTTYNNGATLTVGTGNGSSQFDGTIVGNGTSGTNNSSTPNAFALSLTKTGSGTFTLTNTETFSGATTVNGGTLSLGNGANLGATAITVNTGGTLAIAQNASGTTNTIANGTSAFTLASGGALSMADGYTSTLTLSGSGAASLAPATGASTLLTFDVIGANNDLLNFTSATAVVSAGAIGAKIAIAPSATQINAGPYTLIQSADGSSALNSANFSLANTVVPNVGGLYTASLSSSTATALKVSFTADASALYWKGGTTDWSTAANWAANPDGTGANSVPVSTTDVAFSATGAGSLTTNTLTAPLTVNSVNFLPGAASVTVASSANALTINGGGITNSSANAMTINNPITLGVAQTWTNNGAGLLTIGGTVTNAANTLTVAGSGSTTISGAIGSGAGGLTMNGTGTLTLSGPSSYSGATAINSGIVKLGNASALGTTAGNTTIASGATLDLNGQTIAEPFGTIAGSGVGGNGALINSSGTVATLSGNIGTGATSPFTVGGSGSITLSGSVQIGNGITVTKIGAGTLTLGGSSDNSGMLLNLSPNSGTVILNKASGGSTHALGNGTNTVGSGSTLQLSGTGGDQIYSGGSVTISSGGVFDLNGQSEGFYGLSLAGTGISGGGALINNNGSTTSTLTPGNNTTLTGDTSIGGSANIILQNAVNGVYALTKIGNGTLTLSGTNGFSSATAINGGTLLLSGTGAINSSTGITISGSGAKFVQTSSTASTPAITLIQGTLDGTTTVGNVTVADLAGNTIAAGNGGTGTLTTGNLTFNGAAAINLSSATAVTSTLTVGTLTLGAINSSGTVTLTAGKSAWTAGNTKLIGYTTFSGTNFNDLALAGSTVTGVTSNQKVLGLVNNTVSKEIDVQIAGNTSGIITWGTPTLITNPTAATADANVLNLGALTYGYTGNNQASIVNGVSFSASGVASGNPSSWGSGNIGLSGFNGGVVTNTFGSPTGLSSAYGVLTTGGAYAVGATSATVTFNNLTANHVYATQVWVNDSRGYGSGRTETVTSTGGNTVTLDYNSVDNAGLGGSTTGGGGQYAIGGFTASGTFQAFTMLGNVSTEISSIQLRDVTGVWSGGTNGTWDTGSSSANLNWTGNNNFNMVTTQLTTSGAVYFGDTDGFGNTITNNAVTVAAGGVSIGTVNFLNNSVDYTLASADSNGITGSASLVKSGVGTLTLNGANSYTGTTTISAGTVKLGNATALGTTAGNTTIASGATLDLNGQTIDEPFGTIVGSGVGGNGALINSSATPASITGTISAGTSSFTIGGSGNITLANVVGGGSFTVTKIGAGTLTLGGSSDNSGMLLNLSPNSGTVILNKASGGSTHALGNGTNTVGSGSTLQLSGTGGDQIYSGGSVTISSGGVFDLNGQSEGFYGLSLAGTGISGGGALINNNGSTTSTLTPGNNTTLTGDTSIGGSANIILQNAISGGFALTKIGNGTLTLSGSNAYTNGTTVSAGTLLVSNTTGSGTGTGTVAVNGGTLGGNGYIGTSGLANGAITVASGAKITSLPTAATSLAASTLTSYSTSGVTLSPGSGFTWNVASTSIYDQIAANQLIFASSFNPLSTDSPFTIYVTGNSGLAMGTQTSFVIASASSGITINGTAATNSTTTNLAAVGQNFVLNLSGYSGNDSSSSWRLFVEADAGLGGGAQDLVLVTPEPGSLGLWSVASLGLLRRRRSGLAAV